VTSKRRSRRRHRRQGVLEHGGLSSLPVERVHDQRVEICGEIRHRDCPPAALFSRRNRRDALHGDVAFPIDEHPVHLDRRRRAPLDGCHSRQRLPPCRFLDGDWREQVEIVVARLWALEEHALAAQHRERHALHGQVHRIDVGEAGGREHELGDTPPHGE
jgi:hypothetical protein